MPLAEFYRHAIYIVIQNNSSNLYISIIHALLQNVAITKLGHFKDIFRTIKSNFVFDSVEITQLTNL